MSCINCNGRDVKRDGDQFTCARCGFTWDVAHEQANRAYLRTQGREPAKTMAELAEIEAASSLEAALGLDASLGLTGGGEKQEPSAQDLLIAALVKYTVPELDDLAEVAQINLGEARLKEEKISAMVLSGKLELDEHGAVIEKED